MGRNLVNFTNDCLLPGCAAIQESDASEIIYGPQGPEGAAGVPGLTGSSGRNAFTTTTGAFFMPPEGSLAAASVADNRSFVAGQRAYVAGVGYFLVDSLTGTTQLNLRNLGGTSAVPSGSLIGSGLKVTSGAEPGWDVPGNVAKRYACIAHREDMGEDGGQLDVQVGSGSDAYGYGVIKHLEVISDASSIVTITGNQNQRFKLPVGSWRIRVRTPSRSVGVFQVYLVERPGPDTVFNQLGSILAHGNGFAGTNDDGVATPQRHAVAEYLAAVSDPEKYFEVELQTESFKFSWNEDRRNRVTGTAANFDDGVATPVREIYTVIEIIEI